MGTSSSGEMDVVVALVRSSFLVNAVYAQAAREYGITSQQGQLMCVLMPRPYGMSDLGAVLGLAKSSLTGLVDRTAQRGFLRRVPDPDDARAVRIELTPAGRELVESFYDETCRRVEELPGGLDASEREQLAALLTRVVEDNHVPVVFSER